MGRENYDSVSVFFRNLIQKRPRPKSHTSNWGGPCLKTLAPHQRPQPWHRETKRKERRRKLLPNWRYKTELILRWVCCSTFTITAPFYNDLLLDSSSTQTLADSLIIITTCLSSRCHMSPCPWLWESPKSSFCLWAYTITLGSQIRIMADGPW